MEYSRSASCSNFSTTVYSRLLGMHEELSKSSNHLNLLINQSLKQLSTQNKEEARFSFAAQEQQQEQLSFEKDSIKDNSFEIEQVNNNLEREQILENKIKIYDSALITLEEENREKDQQIERLQKLLNGQNPDDAMQNPDEKKAQQNRFRELISIEDGHLAYLTEREDLHYKIQEQQKLIKENTQTISSQQMEISRLKHINAYLHKSIDKLQKL